MDRADSKELLSACSNSVSEIEINEKSNQTNEDAGKHCATFDFTEKSWMTDFTLVVEGTELHVAKNILALVSPVFYRMFQSDFKERGSDVLELPGKKVEDVKDFLRGFYPSTTLRLSKEVALRVLPLAEEYQVLHLKRRCDEALLRYLEESTPTVEVFRILKEACLYDLKDCQERAVRVVSGKSKEDIYEAMKTTDLPTGPRGDILWNLGERLSKKNEELESSILHLTAQLKTGKTLKRYLSNTLKKSRLLRLDKDLVWTGKTFRFASDIKKKKNIEECVTICDINVIMKINYKSNYSREPLYISFQNNEEYKIECSFNVHVVVVNKIPTEEHDVAKSSFNFSEYKQWEEFLLGYSVNIQDPKKGFVCEKGKVMLEVNIFMSTPKRLDSKNIVPED